jgi:hypothetical protein
MLINGKMYCCTTGDKDAMMRLWIVWIIDAEFLSQSKCDSVCSMDAVSALLKQCLLCQKVNWFRNALRTFNKTAGTARPFEKKFIIDDETFAFQSAQKQNSSVSDGEKRVNAKTIRICLFIITQLSRISECKTKRLQDILLSSSETLTKSWSK